MGVSPERRCHLPVKEAVVWRAGEEHSTKGAQSVREQEKVGCGQSGGGGQEEG